MPLAKSSPEDKDWRDRELKSQVVQPVVEGYRREKISKGRLLNISKKLGLRGHTLVDLAGAAKMS